MPHIIVKMYSGRSEEMKTDLAAKLAETTCAQLGVPESAVTVAVEEYAKEQWQSAVAQPDIIDKKETLYFNKH